MNYYDYECPEPNYPEVEEIIKNATDEFSKFLHDAFKEEYDDINIKNKSVTELAEKYWKKLKVLDEREKQLNQKEQDIEASKTAIYHKIRNDWFKSIGLNFDIGDTVYYKKNASRDIPCEACKGVGETNVIVGGKEYHVQCPICHGQKYEWIPDFFKVQEAKVHKINILVNKDEHNIMSIVEDTTKYEERISGIWVGDVDSKDGRYLKPSEVYKTKEEVEKLIKKEKGQD